MVLPCREAAAHEEMVARQAAADAKARRRQARHDARASLLATAKPGHVGVCLHCGRRVEVWGPLAEEGTWECPNGARRTVPWKRVYVPKGYGYGAAGPKHSHVLVSEPRPDGTYKSWCGKALLLHYGYISDSDVEIEPIPH
jgi:hypothetical protein